MLGCRWLKCAGSQGEGTDGRTSRGPVASLRSLWSLWPWWWSLRTHARQSRRRASAGAAADVENPAALALDGDIQEGYCLERTIASPWPAESISWCWIAAPGTMVTMVTMMTMGVRNPPASRATSEMQRKGWVRNVTDADVPQRRCDSVQGSLFR
jgi:hypothetical protein